MYVYVYVNYLHEHVLIFFHENLRVFIFDVCMHVYIYICKYTCTCMCTMKSMSACLFSKWKEYVHLNTYKYTQIHTCEHTIHVHTCEYTMYTNIRSMNISIYIYIYIYIYMYTYTHIGDWATLYKRKQKNCSDILDVLGHGLRWLAKNIQKNLENARI